MMEFVESEECNGYFYIKDTDDVVEKNEKGGMAFVEDNKENQD